MKNILKKYWPIIVAIIAIALLVVFSPARAFDYKEFPNLDEQTPIYTAYHANNDIFWQVFDLDEDEIPDAALGYKPIEAVPVFVMTPLGMRVVWQVDIEGCEVCYYWLDLDGNGLPYENGAYDQAEILYDPAEDGLNGNEEIAFQLFSGTST